MNCIHTAVAQTVCWHCIDDELTQHCDCIQVAQGSPVACETACKQLMPQLSAAAAAAAQPNAFSHSQQPHSSSQHTQRLALTTILAILKAAGKLSAAGVCEQDPLAATGSTIFAAVSSGQSKPAQAPLATHAASLIPGSHSSMDSDTVSEGVAVQDQSLKQLAGGTGHHKAGADQNVEGSDEGAQLLRLQVLTELVSLPASLGSLAAQVIIHVDEDFHYFSCKLGLRVDLGFEIVDNLVCIVVSC